MSEHTPTPWFVSGVRFRMNGGEWQSINRYDESKKQDENIACVGYDPRTGLGRADAHFIVKAVNNHDALVKALENIAARVPKKNPAWLRITCPICNYKSVEPHTEARHAPNCAGEVARAAIGAMSCIPGAVVGSETP